MSKAFTLFIGSSVDDYGLNPFEFRILCRIARRGKSTEAETAIAQSTGISRGKVREALSVLEQMNMIQITRKGKGKRPEIKLRDHPYWKDPQHLETTRQNAKPKKKKPAKSCTSEVQPSCTPDEQLSSKLYMENTTSCTPDEQHKVLQEGNKGRSVSYKEGDNSALDPVKLRAREFFHKWQTTFPRENLSAQQMLPFLELAHSYDYKTPNTKAAFDEACRLWLIGVNTSNWNPTNLKGLFDKFRKIMLSNDKPQKRQTTVTERKKDYSKQVEAEEQRLMDIFNKLGEELQQSLLELAQRNAATTAERHPINAVTNYEEYFDTLVRVELLELITNEEYANAA